MSKKSSFEDISMGNGIPVTLETRLIFRLFRYSVIAASAIAFLLVAVLYVLLTFRTEDLIVILSSLTFLLLSVITAPKNPLLNKALAVLGGATPMVMSIISGQAWTGLMFIESSLAALGGAGAYALTNDKWKGFGAGIASELLSKSYRIWILQYLQENRWMIENMPHDAAKMSEWLTTSSIWRLSVGASDTSQPYYRTKKRDLVHSAVYHYVLVWKESSKPTLESGVLESDKAGDPRATGSFLFEVYQKQFDLEDKITDIDYRLRDARTLSAYGLVFSRKWETAFRIATNFRDTLGNDPELLRMLNDEQYMKDISLFLKEVIPPPLEYFSRKREVERLSTLHKRYREVLEELNRLMKADRSKNWCKIEMNKALASLQTSLPPWNSMSGDAASDLRSKKAELEQLVEEYKLALSAMEGKRRS